MFKLKFQYIEVKNLLLIQQGMVIGGLKICKQSETKGPTVFSKMLQFLKFSQTVRNEN